MYPLGRGMSGYQIIILLIQTNENIVFTFCSKIYLI